MPDAKENRDVQQPNRTPGQAEGSRDMERPKRAHDRGDLAEPGKTPGSAESGGL